MGSRTRSLHVIAKFALLLILTATLGGCVRMEDGGTSPTHLTLVSADGQRLDATATPLTEKPAIPEAAARERAGMALTDSKQATAVQAHFRRPDARHRGNGSPRLADHLYRCLLHLQRLYLPCRGRNPEKRRGDRSSARGRRP